MNNFILLKRLSLFKKMGIWCYIGTRNLMSASIPPINVAETTPVANPTAMGTRFSL